MNERIRELYQQAHMVREYPADDPMRGGNPPTVYWGERSPEKFAELIIRHVIARLEAEADLAYEQGQGYAGATLNALTLEILDDFDMEIGEDE